MGILASKSQKATPGVATKRRSTQLDFGNLTPLKPGGTVGFSSFRDNEGPARGKKSRKKSNGNIVVNEAMDEDSEDDDDEPEIIVKMEDSEDKDVKTLLSPDDAKSQSEIADGVNRIKVSPYTGHFKYTS
jgi:hypothetical protein